MSDRQDHDPAGERCAAPMPGARAAVATEVLHGRAPAAPHWEALGALPPRVALGDPPLSYAERGEVSEMSVGGIGPVRARSFDRSSNRTARRPLESQRCRPGAGTNTGRAS